MNLTEHTVLVTGANRGIGRRLAQAFADAGARRVYAAHRGHAALTDGPPRTAGQAEIVPLTLDVTDPDSVARAAEAAPDVTLLVNNAGVLDFGDILEAPLEALERNLAVNLYGTLRMARAFAPVVEGNGGGAIVNVLTLVALASMPGLSVYNASKAAAWSMSQSLRATLAPRGVAVVNVFPGAVDTDMLAGVELPKASPEDIAARVVAGLRADAEDIFPDPMSEQLYAAWCADHKAVERQFATM